MPTTEMFYYTKTVLETVSFDPDLFCKELKKAINSLLPYDLELLNIWVRKYIIGKPELHKCLVLIE